MYKYVSGASLKDTGVPCGFFFRYVVQLLTVLKNSNKNVIYKFKKSNRQAVEMIKEILVLALLPEEQVS